MTLKEITLSAWEEEKAVLNKFKDGNIISSDRECMILEKYASLGLVNLGVHINGTSSASLTAHGYRYYNVVKNH